jgi:hypothetical protein
MRFVEDGPDIPNGLIRKWRDGEVLFLAGAGVSVPSGLPLFEGLALSAYEKLGDSLFGTLSEARSSPPTERAKLLDDAILSPEMRVEANLFFDKQFDRFFSALEKRIDPDITGKAKTRKVRKAVEDILSGKESSDSHSDLLRLSLSPNPSKDPSKPLSCRIVTTNFDLLFESAWLKEIDNRPISFDARMAPRPGAHNFEGVIHLHGHLSDVTGRPADYILSSRDFSRVYLRSGIIGNYAYDLIRRYTLLLVGYSLDDPPMRYLMDAIGEDSSLFDDMNRPFVISDLTENIDEQALSIEEATWRAKEIYPILFKRRTGPDPFAPLWESIREWANWARDEGRWIENKLKTSTQGQFADASPFRRSIVQDLLSVLTLDELAAAITYLNSLGVDFGWTDTVSTAIEAARTNLDRSKDR